MTDDVTRGQLEEIIQWWPILDDVADSLLGVAGHGITLDGVRSDSTDSATELAVLQLDQIDQINRDIVALARKLGWRTIDGNPRLYVHAHLAWARKNLSPHELDPVITDIHKRIARLTGHAPRPTGRTCPACGQDQLQLLDNEMLHCGACDITRHPDEIQALTTWRITQSTMSAPLPLVAKHLDIPPSTIRTWIARGHLTRHTDGTIHIPTTRTLAHQLHNPPST